MKRYCISLLEKLGSFQYTREILEELDKSAREEVCVLFFFLIFNICIQSRLSNIILLQFKVKRLGGNPLLDSLLDDLLNWNIDTKKVKHDLNEDENCV